MYQQQLKLKKRKQVGDLGPHGASSVEGNKPREGQVRERLERGTAGIQAGEGV
jgi:hypothetical protein